jgi:hypothetical protein
MTTGKTILNVFNPSSRSGKVTRIKPSPRIKDLTGKKIGIIFNDKPMGRVFLPYLQESLKKRIDGVELRTWIVTTLEKEEIKQTRIGECVKYSDAVVTLLGD